MFFLIATIDLPEPEVFEPDGFLGVDLGIINIATTSHGQIMSSRQVNRYRRHKRELRSKLHKKRTKSAARDLKRQRRKEARYATQRNHIIAKKLVATAERTSRGIGLEDLTGIRQRVTAKKDQRARLSSWAFAQLGSFVEYKARRAGVAVVHVDPRNTSRQCSECWHTHRSNRISQTRFVRKVLRDDHARGPQRTPATSPTEPMLCGSTARSTAPERPSRCGRREPRRGSHTASCLQSGPNHRVNKLSPSRPRS
ncbi:transposase [Streptomyces sp. NPDC093982]|uniref:transposase n=1 Tax=Streptomyces sp. NPDC093982 TaxID=3155077 RepID=UPI003442E162